MQKSGFWVCSVFVFHKSMAEGEEAMGQEDWKDKCMVLEALLMKFRMQIIKIRDLTADKVSWREQNSAEVVDILTHCQTKSLNNPPFSTQWIKVTRASLNGSVFGWQQVKHISAFCTLKTLGCKCSCLDSLSKLRSRSHICPRVVFVFWEDFCCPAKTSGVSANQHHDGPSQYADTGPSQTAQWPRSEAPPGGWLEL